MVTGKAGNSTWRRMLAEVTEQVLAGGVQHIREQTGL